MELASIFLRSAAEIALSMLVVGALSVLCLRIGQWTHFGFLAPLVLTALLVGLFFTAGLGGTIRAMTLSFGIASASLMILWAKLGGGPQTPPSVEDPRSRHWTYPALLASIGEMRKPSPRELRALLTRMKDEIPAPGLLPQAKILLIKKVARAALGK